MSRMSADSSIRTPSSAGVIPGGVDQPEAQSVVIASRVGIEHRNGPVDATAGFVELHLDTFRDQSLSVGLDLEIRETR